MNTPVGKLLKQGSVWEKTQISVKDSHKYEQMLDFAFD